MFLTFLDIPIHSVEVLSFPGGFAGYPLRSGNRYVVARVYIGGDAYRGATIQRCQRSRPDEQNRRGVRHAAQTPTRHCQ